jgi:hypothetical protein
MAQTMQYQFSRLASQINLYDLWDNLVLCSFAENYVCYLAFVIDDNKTVLNHCQTVGVHTVDDWALYYFSFCHSTSSRKEKQMYHCTNYKKQGACYVWRNISIGVDELMQHKNNDIVVISLRFNLTR